MASMKTAQFLKPLIPLVHLRPKSLHPLDLGCSISNDFLSSPNDTLHVKERISKEKRNQVKSHSN